MLNGAASESQSAEVGVVHDSELPGGQIRQFPVT
jgi:hypothetical protein